MSHPYTNAAPERLWRKAISGPRHNADPVINFPFKISQQDKVVAAGSCFAQHISSRLSASGYNFLVTEPGHPILSQKIADDYNYGRFSARYGNIYTARQLLQLFRRAYGRFSPSEEMWINDQNRFFDPFRPQIQPGGFASEAEFRRDQSQHFAAVRSAFESMDVLIFTLGLTECWENATDGAVFPVCPGTAAGLFDASLHRFRNQEVQEIVDDLLSFLRELREINEKAKIILTVSPVPLVATATDGHVLPATIYSKSVLRVAADIVCRRDPAFAYFPSYEIITGPQARGAFFAEDLRSVTADGVDRVMELFFHHVGDAAAGVFVPDEVQSHERYMEEANRMNQAMCDEVLLDQGH